MIYGMKLTSCVYLDLLCTEYTIQYVLRQDNIIYSNYASRNM